MQDFRRNEFARQHYGTLSESFRTTARDGKNFLGVRHVINKCTGYNSWWTMYDLRHMKYIFHFFHQASRYATPTEHPKDQQNKGAQHDAPVCTSLGEAVHRAHRRWVHEVGVIEVTGGISIDSWIMHHFNYPIGMNGFQRLTLLSV